MNIIIYNNIMIKYNIIIITYNNMVFKYNKIIIIKYNISPVTPPGLLELTDCPLFSASLTWLHVCVITWKLGSHCFESNALLKKNASETPHPVNIAQYAGSPKGKWSHIVQSVKFWSFQPIAHISRRPPLPAVENLRWCTKMDKYEVFFSLSRRDSNWNWTDHE